MEALTASAARRRYLTVLFADLCDSTQIGNHMEAEAYFEMLHAVRTCCREVIERHGGQIARIQGDGVLAIFGFPESREDDGRRAVEAALELHEAVASLPFVNPVQTGAGLRLHSGVHTGLTLVGSGDMERGRFDILGAVPNAAAAIASAAGVNEIFVSAATLGPDAHFFEVNRQTGIPISGLVDPVIVSNVIGRAGIRRRFEAQMARGTAPLIGRESTLSILRDALRDTSTNRARTVMISGEAGLGKSRLIEEVLRPESVSGFRVMRGFCENYLGAEALQPFKQILRGHFGIGGDDPNPLETVSHDSGAEAALQAARSLVDPRGQVSETGGVPTTILRDFFDVLGRERPILLVIDDWQWADEATATAYEAICELSRPLLFLLATRGQLAVPFGDGDVVPIKLQPLGETDSARIIRHHLPGADPFLVEEILGLAEGNPLFIEEICHSVADNRSGRPPEGSVGGGVWLRSLIETRVANLDSELLALVEVAAVLGNVFSAGLFERIAGMSRDDPRLKALAHQDLLFAGEQPGTLRFKHVIARDVIHETIGRERRHELHGLAAQALIVEEADSGRESASELLAYHCAGAERWRDAALHSEKAGDRAMAAFALDRARTQYMAALHALDRTEPFNSATDLQWCGIAQKLGMACVFDPLALSDGIATFERGAVLAERSGSLQDRARSAYWLGYVCYAKGLAGRAVRHCEQALTFAGACRDQRLAAQVTATLGQALAAAAEYDRALPLFEDSLSAKRSSARPGSSVAVGSAYTLACKGSVLGDRGEFVAAEACFAEALQLLGDSRHQVVSSVNNWIAAVYMWQGRWQDAITVLDRSIGVAEHVRSRHLLAMSNAQRGYCLWMSKGDVAGLDAIAQSIEWIEDRRGAFLSSLLYGWMVEGAVARGDLPTARRHGARLLMRARQREHVGEPMGCRALARDAAARGQGQVAERYLRRAESAARRRSSAHEAAHNLLCRAEVYAGGGDMPAARAGMESALAEYDRMEMTWYAARARELLKRHFL